MPQEHDRVCGYAFAAMETLLAKQQHQAHCQQCRSDPAWCNTAKEYDANFTRSYQLWLRNRGSNGVVMHREPVAAKGAS